MRDDQPGRRDLEARLARYGYALAVGGLILGFGGDCVGSRALALVGASVLAAGILAGGISVVMGFVRFPRELGQALRTAPWRHACGVDSPTGRPWLIRGSCLAGFAAAGGLLLASLLWIAMPAWRELAQRLGWAPDPGALVVVLGAAVALVGYWRMRRWAVWLMGALVVLAPLALAAAGSPAMAWGNLLGLVLFLVIGIRHYQQMA